MHALLNHLRMSLIATAIFTVLCCALYPLVVWGAAQLVFPYQANGSLLTKDGVVVGSALIGQQFTAPRYFHPRPSAAGNGYDATSSGGSNLGPTSAKLIDGIRQRSADYRQENSVPAEVLLPVDAVTSSASGLDPHISVANALLQAPRIVRERKLAPEIVARLIHEHTVTAFGILGEPGVNVLTLNLALDAQR